MDPILAPLALLFVASLGIDFGLFSKDEDAAEAPQTPPDTPPAETDAFDPSRYSGVISGTAGDDNLSAEEGSALAWFLGDGNDSLDGSTGDDYAEGGAGNDQINLRDGRDLGYGGDGDDRIDAGIGFDTVFGGNGADTLIGNGGNDILHGDDGNDELRGGTGEDHLFGGAGDDVLFGLENGLSSVAGSPVIDGVDRLYGGDGNDRLILGPGDIGSGGAGADEFVIDHSRPDLTAITHVTDFTSGDSLEVQYLPTHDDTGTAIIPTISLAMNATNTGALLRLDNVVIANIIGGQSLTADQILLTPLLR